MNCIFCDIVDGKIPASKIYEDDQYLAFLDISQGTQGHTLIIPKQHCENIYELPDYLAENYLKVVKKIACALKKAFNCEGLNLVNNNGKVAGQTVFHYHIHLIPRYNENDKVTISHQDNSSKVNKEDFEERVKMIKQYI